MPNFANIVLNDGQGTPVAHTFAPRKIDNLVAKWQDLSGGVPVGFPTLRASLREPIKGSKDRNYKAIIDIDLPTLETVSNSTYSGVLPAPQKAYANVARIEFLLPERGTSQDRKNVRAYIKNALDHADIKAMIEDLSAVF